ncbi:MAG: class IV adenylate cyclase [Candidatus Nezhaarchaeota archaeon]|nr:class IV adenylate cyclase [Candidatus Nezhaarchaeota archaeon]MCX8141991.1 class IV adenylate cyclase [Candidatus Nezhaarchaeota archaeon]MDW8050228.1 class IV adenylate cyclase [Nitrososphaerota archaeon]
MIEIEVKVTLNKEEKEEVVRRLNSFGEFVGVYVEEDVFFKCLRDPSYGREKTLKLRRRDDKIKLIFKHRVPSKEFKKSLEIEVELIGSDLKSILQLLEYLGFKESMTIKKKRLTYRMGDCLINLDDVEGLGSFIEIEIIAGEEDAHAKIRELLSRLGLLGKELINRSYAEIIREKTA